MRVSDLWAIMFLAVTGNRRSTRDAYIMDVTFPSSLPHSPSQFKVRSWPLWSVIKAAGVIK